MKHTWNRALITGASSGIGRETVERLAGLGATVHLTSRSAERAERAAQEINRAVGRGRVVGRHHRGLGRAAWGDLHHGG